MRLAARPAPAPIRPSDVDAIKDAKAKVMASALIIDRPGNRPVAYDAMRAVVAGAD